MSTTPNMNLDLPVVNTTAGPAWATAVNAAFDGVDSHDHSTGKGVKITPAGMNIISDLAMNENNLTEVRSVRFEDQGTVQAAATDVGCLQLVSGDLWWVNASGAAVQITAGAGLSFSSLGTIGGDFGQPGVTASVTYSDTTKVFSFLQNSGITAKLYAGTISLADASSGALAVSITANAASAAYTLVMPISAPASDTVLTFDSTGQATFRTISGTAGEITVSPSIGAHTVSLPSTVTKAITFSGANTFSDANTFTGNTSGRGIIPLGAVIATFPHLTGAYACSATTAADSNGFVQCAGQTISDVTSALNGQVIPNINNNAFLMGNATSGTAGGANTKTLTTTELPAHTHVFDHGHANTFALGGTTSFASTTHTHNMDHVHQSVFASSTANRAYALTSIVPTTYSFTSGAGTDYFSGSSPTTKTAGGDSIDAHTASIFGEGYTGGSVDSGGNKANTGTPSATGTVSFSGAVTNFTGSTVSTGTGSSFDIRPSYITARYVMRVK